MKPADSAMAAKTSEGSIKWQLCYDISARTWWMMKNNLPLPAFSSFCLFYFVKAPGFVLPLRLFVCSSVSAAAVASR
ncbi:hypothetical protein F2P81_005143 [Scophthalmus maximus]|uniref:Uncharacterized protein n=1 Tax=Scophthalmus maximus TaxID=52904 RepID=A0A6A4TFH5_SCOMX|nr:hypothetical protein F2P81_005143 [Scophthalmus maximus]